METLSIDINADVGEGVNNEAELLPLLSSCNIACGGHAGNEETMRQVIQIARTNKVKIGAHPSYPDKENFGRQFVEMSCAALFHSVKAQIHSLRTIIKEEHLQLHHVKPHGALYNTAAKDERTAEVIVEVMKSIPLPLRLYVPYGSVIAKMAIAEKIPITYEAFADRNYNENLSLVPRVEENAMIVDPNEMFDHVNHIILHQKVKTISGVEVPIKAETFCIHGDSPNAFELLKSLRHKLLISGVKIQ